MRARERPAGEGLSGRRVVRTLRTPVLGCVMVGLGACGGTASTSARPSVSAHSPFPPATASPSPAPTPTVFPAPVVVQVENSPEARPQSGLQAADIVYEYVAEGGISRLSAVFMVPPHVTVGPVRSVRLATVQIVSFLQAVLAYSGASTYIEGRLRQAGVKHYMEDTAFGDLFRIGSRVPPHNLYTDGKALANLVQRAAAPPVAYSLWARSAPPAATGVPVSRVTVPISNFEHPTFVWRQDLGGFTRSEADTGVAVDANTRSPLVFPTVIVQQVVVTTAPEVHDVNGVLGVNHALSGQGAAQVFTAGREFDAGWTQPATGPPQFTLASGVPAPVAPGPVWICLVPVGGVGRIG